MSDQFLLPDLGEGLTEAEIVTWLVAEGDLIAIDQPVVEVESAKSVVELPSPYGGRVTALHVAAGQSVERGAPLLTIDAEQHAADSAPAVPPGDETLGITESPGITDSPDELVPGTALREQGDGPGADGDANGDTGGSGAVLVGYGTREATVRARPLSGRFGGRASTTAAPHGTDERPAASAERTALLDPKRRSPVVSPIVRRLAREHGFDAGELAGSGRDSLVLRSDVEAAIDALRHERAGRQEPLGSAASDAAAQQPTSPSGVAGPAQSTAEDIRIPITGMRKLIGARLGYSRRVIPEATIWLDVDATELFRAKARLEQATGERFGLTALIARFAVVALAKYPILNSSVDDESNEIVQHAAVHLGLAAQTPRGLMVPVVRDADRMSTRRLRDAVGAIVSRADGGEYAASEVSGSTFTVNNYGGFGVDGSAPIINHPEVAMLGVGRIIDRPWVVEGRLEVRKVVVLSFVFDHRVCDGDVASGFLTTVAKCIEQPLLLLADA